MIKKVIYTERIRETEASSRASVAVIWRLLPVAIDDRVRLDDEGARIDDAYQRSKRWIKNV